MLALTFSGRQQISLSRVPTPKVVHPGDVVVEVTLAGICGSDLHPFHERENGIAKGCITGHEFVGHVVSVGSQ
ncbi:ADH_N domain-containing protein [Haematococcus lacustris]|uniref:ADH_N domain-containing protein n=1 Tax=Haematococcus lacustris TaxID=44745 RepID=A0A699ZLE2_HAELA|nr:ADH_N domain-containing protein [Haematococcus lacustris]